MDVLRSLADWQHWLARTGPDANVLVPTMGALHNGHASLVREGAELARRENIPGGCVATIFVNPTQFENPADLARYPKTLDADLELCSHAGASAVFVPSVDDVYPPGDAPIVPPLPVAAIAPKLEDAHRPGHFAGVCQVVLRLFHLTRPKAAIFGEKDWQQLQVIRAMTAERGLPISIIPGPTIRESDGLAMSSRNRFLTPDDRVRARALSRALCDACACPTPSAAESRMREVLAGQSIAPDYAVVRDAQTLGPPTADPARPLRAIIAAPVGPVRLLDNAAWTPAGSGGGGATA